VHRFVSGDGWSSILLRVRQKRELLVAMALPESTGAADPALVDSFSSMSPVPAASPSSPLQDGGEGDDELGDDDDSLSRDDEDEDEEGEDEEPRLKYQRLGGSVPSLLSSDAASCLTVAERIIALGTHDGTVHLLDFQGNQVREFRAHTATVNEVSIDSNGEFVGSCSDDGTVVISSLYTDEKEKFDYQRPMKAVALDPEYSRKTSRQFVAGGLAGQLLFISKGWLGYREQVIFCSFSPL
jgi:WD40 repeat protein